MYGFSTDALEVLLRSNIENRWQRVKINTAFSSWTQLFQGVLKVSAFGTISFNIYINDIFFALKGIDICTFTDGITLYSNLKSVLETLEHNSELAIAWFEMNYMKLNTDKCQLLVSGN